MSLWHMVQPMSWIESGVPFSVFASFQHLGASGPSDLDDLPGHELVLRLPFEADFMKRVCWRPHVGSFSIVQTQHCLRGRSVL